MLTQMRIVGSTIHTRLARYLQTVLAPDVHTSSSSSGPDPWPCPLPPMLRSMGSAGGARRRGRWSRRRLIVSLSRQAVAVLNWLTLGRHPAAKDHPSLRSAPSAVQRAAWRRIEARMRDWTRLAETAGSGLGRALPKFEALEAAVAALELVAVKLAAEMIGYTHGPRRPSGGTAQDGGLGAVAHPIVASRIKFDTRPDFDAKKYLADTFLRAAYVDPRLGRLHPSDWPAPPRVQLCGSRAEVLLLLAKWDSVGALAFVPEKASDPRYRTGLFSIPKDLEHSRQILNAMPENSRTIPLAEAVQTLSCAFDLTSLLVRKEEVVRVFTDDLSDFYHQFRVTPARTSRNHLRMVLSAEEASRFRGYRGDGVSPVVPCFASLAMGDSLAVEIAQHAHETLLGRAGLRRPAEVVRSGSPLPRGPYLDLLQIDDHVGIELVRRGEGPRRAPEVFGRAGEAYARARLPRNEKKAVRDADGGLVLGGHLDGEGWISAPPPRVLALMEISVRLAQLGIATRPLLEALVGCWVYVVMFARPALCLVDALFKAVQESPPNACFRLRLDARDELLILAAVAPLLYTDLRAPVAPYLFCVDASPWAGGVVAARVPAKAAEEWWRLADHRGQASRLASGLGAYLSEWGARSAEAAELDALASLPAPRAPPKMKVVYDVLEIFAGGEASNFSRSFEERGARVLRLGLATGFDLHEPAVRWFVVGLVLKKAVRCIQLAPPCTQFSPLRRPALRSMRCPLGFEPQRPEVRAATSLAMFSAFVATLAAKEGIMVMIEQPKGSMMRFLGCFRRLEREGIQEHVFPFCQFGAPFLRLSRWWSNVAGFASFAGECRCGEPHVRIQGRFDEAICEAGCRGRSWEDVYGVAPRPGESVASFCALYPKALCESLAEAVLADPRWREPRTEVAPARLPAETPFWVEEAVQCLPLRVRVQYPFRRAGHINVNEHRVYKTLVKLATKTCPGGRFVYGSDSMVSSAVAAKGRSSSMALNVVQRGLVGYTLGSGTRLAPLRVASSLNPADDPSRGVALRPPSRGPPRWLQELEMGRTRAFDLAVAADRFPRPWCFWARLLLQVVGSGFDATLGYPGEGPRPRKLRRREANLDAPLVGPIEARRRRRGLRLFEAYLEELGINPCLVFGNALVCGTALRVYGKQLYAQDFPLYLFVQAILAVRDLYPHYRNELRLAWQVAMRWEADEPAEHRAVLPVVAVRAAVAVALLWRWWDWAACFLLGFSALLRPSEWLAATRGCLLLPRDMLEGDHAFLAVLAPKTKRTYRRQHARVAQTNVVRYLDALYGQLPPSTPLFALGAAAFRHRWDTVFQALGFQDHLLGSRLTPACLRGSGATALYRAGVGLKEIAWQGRWARPATLECYIQEVAAAAALMTVPTTTRERVQTLAAAAPALIEMCIVILAARA